VLAFCALIHKFHPTKIDFSKLSKENKEKNLALAFSVAESVRIPALLDVEDVVSSPEPLSIITYLSQFYHAFNKTKKQQNVGHLDPNNMSNEEIMQENDRRVAENERKKEYNEWVQQENAHRMAENEKRIAEWKKKQQGNVKEKSANCASCGKPLEGETIELGETGKEYHKKCFACANCKKKITQKPILVEGSPYCEQCGRTAFIKAQLSKSNPNIKAASSTPDMRELVNKPEKMAIQEQKSLTPEVEPKKTY